MRSIAMDKRTAVPRNVTMIASYAASVLDLARARLPDEYYYGSLPLCVIDAVYSISVRYKSVQNTVASYCKYVGCVRDRPYGSDFPPVKLQHQISQLCELGEALGPERMASEVFHNRQRTSPRGGILKAQAVHRFALIFANTVSRAFRTPGAEKMTRVSRAN
ncbi:MAG: hypothetical protein AB7U73_11155 [Pirellulales bacterium]